MSVIKFYGFLHRSLSFFLRTSPKCVMSFHCVVKRIFFSHIISNWSLWCRNTVFPCGCSHRIHIRTFLWEALEFREGSPGQMQVFCPLKCLELPGSLWNGGWGGQQSWGLSLSLGTQLMGLFNLASLSARLQEHLTTAPHTLSPLPHPSLPTVFHLLYSLSLPGQACTSAYLCDQSLLHVGPRVQPGKWMPWSFKG